MKTGIQLYALIALLGAMTLQGAEDGKPSYDKSLIEGRRIARMLLGQRPTENAAVAGSIEVRPRSGEARTIPFQSRVVVDGDGEWRAIYETESAGAAPAMRLTIRHTRNVAADFFVQERVREGGYGELRKLSWKEVFQPFAGSDFRIIDLAYPHSDHLTWPTQRLLDKDIRRGQSCYELESVNPNPGQGGFARVISWIDIDTGGPLEITGYDSNDGKLLQFSPKRFRKIDGEFKVTELHISNRETRSRTVLRFDFRKSENEAAESRQSALDAKADAEAE